VTSFSLSVTPMPPIARVAVSGEIDVTSASDFADAVTRLGSSFDAIEFDLSDVSFMDASGMRAFEEACDEADRLGFSYRVVALSRAAGRVFALTGRNALLHCG
jgi:anti-sigma B factor antagonist